MRGQRTFRTLESMERAIERDGLKKAIREVVQKSYHDGKFHKPIFTAGGEVEADRIRTLGYECRVESEG